MSLKLFGPWPYGPLLPARPGGNCQAGYTYVRGGGGCPPATGYTSVVQLSLISYPPTRWLMEWWGPPAHCGPLIFENMLYFSTLPWYLRVWESRCWDNIRLIFKHLYTGYPGETAHTEPKEVDRRKLLIFYLSVGSVWFSSLLVPSHQKSELLVPSTPLSA